MYIFKPNKNESAALVCILNELLIHYEKKNINNAAWEQKVSGLIAELTKSQPVISLSKEDFEFFKNRFSSGINLIQSTRHNIEAWELLFLIEHYGISAVEKYFSHYEEYEQNKTSSLKNIVKKNWFKFKYALS